MKTVADLVTRFPKQVLLLTLLLTALSGWRVQKLHINHNQLEMMPERLPSVIATKELVELLGGVGHFIVALKADDQAHLKAVVEELGAELEKLPEVRLVTYKQDVDFVRYRVGYFVATDDLKVAYKRVRKKVRAILRKQSPLGIELIEVKDEPLELGDIIEKYQRINKKGIDDPYYSDPSGQMITMVVKPSGGPNDLDFVRKLVKATDKAIARYNKNNTQQAVLKEHYAGFAPGATVTYGYTGSYKTNLDDSESIQAALVPTSVVAFAGILLYLIFFLRRFRQMLLLMALLLVSVLCTFGLAEVLYGQLNTVTAMLGAILMGLGIDFGIHFIYRIREEYGRIRESGDSPYETLRQAVHETVHHSGRAAAISAATVASALYILAISEFEGFSEFGIIMGSGVLITACFMYTALPAACLLLGARSDKFCGSFEKKLSKGAQFFAWRPQWARPMLIAFALLTVVFGFLALEIRFDFDARSLMTTDRPSILLKEEINRRYNISADPAGIYTPKLEDAKAIYEHFKVLPEDTTIDSVVSLFTIIPEQDQQLANRKILDKLKRKMDAIDPNFLEEKERKLLEQARPYLETPPYTLDDVPDHITQQFKPVAESERQGYMTYFYPKVAVWDGKALMRFADEIGRVVIGGTPFFAAGMAVLYADLARVVIADGINFTLFAGLAILIVILLTFRSLQAVVFAILPLVAGMVWMLGLMTLTGWRINFMNIVVLPVVFGYGISSGVHLYHRYLEKRSVAEMLRHTGAAVIASSITTLVGWMSLLISHHRGLESMGILATFGIAGALLISLFVLPAMLQLIPGGGDSSER